MGTVDDDLVPPLPKGLVAVKQQGSQGVPALPKGLVPVDEKKKSSPFDFTHGYKPTSEDLKVKKSYDDLEKSFDTKPVPGLQEALNAYQAHLSPQDHAEYQKAQQAIANRQPDQIRQTTKKEQDAQHAMDTTMGKISKSMAYIGSETAKGGVDVLKGGAWVLNHMNTSLSDTQLIPDKSFKGIDQATDLGVTKGQREQIEGSKDLGMGAARTLGMIGNIAPAAIGGEAAEIPKTMFALQGFGQARDQMDAVDPDHKLNPAVRDLYIATNGGVNALIMGDLGEGLLSKPVQEKVVSGIVSHVMEDAAEKGLTEDAVKESAKTAVKDFSGKFYELAEKTGKTGVDLSALQAAQFALKKGVDLASPEPVFNENLGNLMSNISDVVTKQAPLFGGVGAMLGGSPKDPNEVAKRDLGEQVQQKDADIAKYSEKTDDPVKNAENEVNLEQAKKDREELNNQLKNVILKQKEHETKNEGDAGHPAKTEEVDATAQQAGENERAVHPEREHGQEGLTQGGDEPPLIENQDATKEKQIEEGGRGEHPQGDESRKATEAGSGDSPVDAKEGKGQETPPQDVNTFSVKNAKIDESRKKRGLAPLMSEGKKDFGTVWDNAMSRLDDDHEAGVKLVSELEKNPRATTDEENALFLHRQIQIKNEYDKLNEQFLKAKDEGESTSELKPKLEAASDELQRIEQVSRKVGTETGRGLNARKMMAKDDFSLASLETQKRIANGGRQLTDEERTYLNRVHKEYAEKEKAYEAKITELEQRNRNLQERQEIEKLKAESRKEARSQRGKQRGSDRDRLVQDIRAKLKIARTTGKVNVSIPFAQQVAELYKISPELAKLAKSYIAEGVDKLEDLVDKIHEHLSEYDKRAIRDALSGYGKDADKETKGELQKKLDDLKQQARLQSKLEDLQNKQYKAQERKKAEYNEDIADLKKQIRDIQKPDVSLKSLKTRTANQIAEYQRRIKEKDFATKPKSPPVLLDPEAITARDELNRVKNEFNAELEKDKLANRGRWEKGWDKFLKYRRAELLLNLSGAAKVGMASAYRILSQPLHEIAGSVLRVLPGIKQIAKKAAREGHGFVGNVEWKAAKTLWNKETLAQVKNKLKGQLDNLDTAFGDKQEHFDTNALLDLAGNIHSAEKEFAKQNEFRRSVLLRTKHAQENGVDTDNPMVQLKIGYEALQDANRQIFMADNLANTLYKNILTNLEQRAKSTNEATKFKTSSKVTAGALRVLLPIVKVPTNYAIEKFQYTPILGATKALYIMAKGLKSMKPEEADYVMRIMKKQSLGAGLVAMGYFNPQAFGGFYTGKRKDGDLGTNDVKILGIRVPHFFTHTPLLTMLQLGATIRRVADGDSKNKTGDASLATAKDFAESTPFYDTPKQAIRAMENANNMSQFVGGFARGLIVPTAVSQAAEYFDKDKEGNPIKRSPHSVTQGIEEGIPGLRQDVPIKEPEANFNRINDSKGDTYILNNKQTEERQKFYDEYMDSEHAKDVKEHIKEAKPIEKKKLMRSLRTNASKYSKRKILDEYYNAETGDHDLSTEEQ